jgi:hypothetical protein
MPGIHFMRKNMAKLAPMQSTPTALPLASGIFLKRMSREKLDFHRVRHRGRTGGHHFLTLSRQAGI